MHDREHIYRKIWENHVNRHGVMLITQQQLAKELGIPYQRVSVIMSEFKQIGYVKKSGSSFQFRDPNRLSWGEEFSDLRKYS
jgi:DNA-binding IclR family transcriptional regulator